MLWREKGKDIYLSKLKVLRVQIKIPPCTICPKYFSNSCRIARNSLAYLNLFNWSRKSIHTQSMTNVARHNQMSLCTFRIQVQFSKFHFFQFNQSKEFYSLIKARSLGRIFILATPENWRNVRTTPTTNQFFYFNYPLAYLKRKLLWLAE
mgnify:CR=1 FL=1